MDPKLFTQNPHIMAALPRRLQNALQQEMYIMEHVPASRINNCLPPNDATLGQWVDWIHSPAASKIRGVGVTVIQQAKQALAKLVIA